MGYPRPKILTEITVPSGGWDLDFIVSSVPGSLDTPLTATIPAGTYFISWDAQSDDLLWHLARQMRTEINTAIGGLRRVYVSLDSSNRVVISFYGNDFTGGSPACDVELTWTTSHADLAAALGFDASADDQSIGTDEPEFTADYQHAYGWYADADGQLASLLTEDVPMTETPQAIAYTGQSFAQQIGERYTNELSLQWLPRALTHSRGIGYGAAPLAPYSRNKGLEAWWHQAKLGRKFRLYREGRNDSTSAVDRIVQTASSSASVTDANKSAETDPQEHYQRLLLCTDTRSTTGLQPKRFMISSHTATVFTSPQSEPSFVAWVQGGSDSCLVLDQRYQTYVVDLSRMSAFAPIERPTVDYYDITIPLLRYES